MITFTITRYPCIHSQLRRKKCCMLQCIRSCVATIFILKLVLRSALTWLKSTKFIINIFFNLYGMISESIVWKTSQLNVTKPIDERAQCFILICHLPMLKVQYDRDGPVHRMRDRSRLMKNREVRYRNLKGFTAYT